MPPNPTKTKRIRTRWSIALLAIFWSVAAMLVIGTKPIANSNGQHLIASAEGSGGGERLEDGWRRTRFGWQHSANWRVDSSVPRPGVEQIHPLVWTLLVLVSVVTATIWATEECELDQMLVRIFRDCEN